MTTTRRIVMFNRVSADGYFASADGRLDWVVHDTELDQAAAASLKGADTILFGRKTYDMFESFWPTALSDGDGDGDAATAQDPHSPARSPELRAMAEWINGATKIVHSKTRREVTWHGSRLVRDFDPRAIEALKRAPGGDIMIFGSGTIVSLLAAHGLIDQYDLVVTAILLGGGQSLFRGMPAHVSLRLDSATTLASGNVRLRYLRS